MKEKIDKGFSYGYWKLSYRRKFIRTLWKMPLLILLLAFLPGKNVFVELTGRGWMVAALLALFVVQVVYNFVMWQRETSRYQRGGVIQESDEAETTNESVCTDSWLHRHGSIKVVALCAPAIMGTAAVIVAQAFRPGNSMPLETTADRLFENLFLVGVPLGLLGLPLLLVGIFFGSRLLWEEHAHSREGVVSIAAMVLGVAAGAYMVIGTLEAVRSTHQHNVSNPLQFVAGTTRPIHFSGKT